MEDEFVLDEIKIDFSVNCFEVKFIFRLVILFFIMI